MYSFNKLLDQISLLFERIIMIIVFAIIVITAIFGFGILLVIAAIAWSYWHPQVIIPLQGTDLALVYRHRIYRTGNPWERLVLAKASSIDTPLDQLVSRIYKHNKVGGELWRNPNDSAYYLALQGGLYRIDVANQTLSPSSYADDVCPSDATAPKWQMEQIEPKKYPSRPANFVFVGAVRNDSFTPADRLPPPSPSTPRRNCAAEAAVWDRQISTALGETGLTVALRVRWLPGETIFHEFSMSPGLNRAWPSNSNPPPASKAMPPRVRFSLYRDGETIYFLEDGDTSSLSDLNLHSRSGSFLKDTRRPACRIDDKPPSKEPADGMARVSRYFERLMWLGRFEARFEPMPNDRWGGNLVFLSPADASEDLHAPERFCDPTARQKAESRRASEAAEAEEKARRKSELCSTKFMAPLVEKTPDGKFRITLQPDERPYCSSAP